MNESVVGDDASDQKLSSPKWAGAQSIGLVHQLNERCIDLLCELSVDPSSEVLQHFVVPNQDLWSRLDAVARKRLAIFPFSIVDVRFQDVDWWQSAVETLSSEYSKRGALDRTPTNRCNGLALEALMFAWQVARENRHVAQVIFAMSPPVVEHISNMTMHQIRLISPAGSNVMRVRWHADQMFWRELLLSARATDTATMAVLRREAQLMFCGELLKTTDS